MFGYQVTQVTFVAALAAFISPAKAAAPYCLAGDACFPSDETLAEFANTLDGVLIKTEPYGAPCYAATYNATQCSELAATVRTFEFREAEPAAVMYINHEITSEGEGCPVPLAGANGSAPLPIEAQCVVGNMASYVVNATSGNDIQAAVKFAAQYNLRLRIKNSGHDYTGRSTGEGAFTIWTLHLKDTEHIEEFVPEGGSGPAVDVVRAGAGVNVLDVTYWGRENSRVAVAGYTPSVGAMGGFLLGGGMGPMAPYYGMAADNVQQFDVVTADGERRIVNAYQNTDLFWALRGGGGAFAAVIQVWMKVFPALPAINTVTGPIVCQDRASYETLVKTMVEIQLPLREANHTGIWSLSSATNSGLLIDAFAMQEGDEIVDPQESLTLLERLTTAPGCEATFRAAQYTGSASYADAYDNALWATAGLSTNPGRNLVDSSRLVSYDMMRDESKVAEIAQAILDLDPAFPFIWQNNNGGVITQFADDYTSVHPAWRKAMSWVVVPISGPWSGLTAEQLQQGFEIDEKLQAVFGSPTYYNEQSDFLANWQDSIWGSNYDRLLSIKKEYDQNNLFACKYCVGSEDGY